MLPREMNQTTEASDISKPVGPQHMMNEGNDDDWDLIHYNHHDDHDEIPNTVKTMAWSFNFDNYSSMMVSEITLPEIVDEDEYYQDFRDSTGNDDDDESDSIMKAFQILPLFRYEEEEEESDPSPLDPSKSLKCGLQRLLPIEKELDFYDDDGSYSNFEDNNEADTTRE